MKADKWMMADLLARLDAGENGAERWLEPYAQGDTAMGLYAPRNVDAQQPHDQDEFYFVMSGTGTFFHDGQHAPVATGDALFVPAGTAHRFEDFSDDFCAWYVLVGKPGGEN